MKANELSNKDLQIGDWVICWLYLEMHKYEGSAWVIPNAMWNDKECEDFINKKDYDTRRMD